MPPEEQFKFSLELALKRKYDEAELALKEFMDLHPNHEKIEMHIIGMGMYCLSIKNMKILLLVI